MKIKYKLLSALAFSVLLITAACVASYYVVNRIHDRVDELIKFPIPSIIRLSQMNQTFLLGVEDSLSYRITGLPEEKRAYYEQTVAFEVLLNDPKTVLGYGTPEIPPEDIPLIEGLEKNWQEFKLETEALFLQKELGPDAGVVAPDAVHYIGHIDGLVEILEDYMALEQEEIEHAHVEISSMTDSVVREILIAGLLIVLMTLITNLLISRSIVRPLANLQEVVESFGKGDWRRRAKEGGKDELGALSGVFNTMADNIEKSQVTMEAKVKERTEELQSKFKEIEDLNALMTGREMKMIELKKEIEELKKERNA